MAMASRIAVMSHGRVLQVGTPKEIYEHPNCRFVADFIGNVNLMEGRLTVDEADHCEVTTEYGVVNIGHGISGTRGMSVAIAVRPEKIHISKTRPAVKVNLFRGKVREIAYFGSYNTFIVEMHGIGSGREGKGQTVKIMETNTTRHETSAVSRITWDDLVFFWWDDSAPVVLTQ